MFFLLRISLQEHEPCAALSHHKPANVSAPGEGCCQARIEKNLSLIFVSTFRCSLLSRVFAASLGAVAGVTVNEFTQMLLSVIHSNFRLCLLGFCIQMQKEKKSDKHFSLFSG